MEAGTWDTVGNAGWNEVEKGEILYELGSNDGKPHLYGPFVVVDIERRLLQNSKGRRFIAYEIGHFVQRWPSKIQQEIKQ